METSNQIAKPGQYLTLLLKSQYYGVPIGTVREINQIGDVVPVPHTPEFVLGVMNLRGKVIPVVDLRKKFGMESAPRTRETCIVVIDGQAGQIGMVVDAVSEVVELAASQIEPSPVLGEESKLSFVRGMGKMEAKVIILVDVVSALSKDEFTRIIPIEKQAA